MKPLPICLLGAIATLNFVLTATAIDPNPIATFSTLGDPVQYDATTGSSVRGATATTFTIYAGVANQFTAGQSGLLSSIEIGLTFPFYAVDRQVDLRLALDVDDFLPPPTGLTGGTLQAAGGFEPGQNSALSIFTPTNQVSIVAGQKYWLILLPHDTQTDVVWNRNAVGAVGRIAGTYYNNNSWGQNPSATQQAFQVNVTPIPEPTAPTIGITGGLLGMAFRICRRKNQSSPCLELDAAPR